MGLRVAVVAKGNGACAAEGLGDDVVVMSRGFLALKASSHEREFTVGEGNGGKGIESFYRASVLADQITGSSGSGIQ